jgi:peptidyl-prolyl cis-trans isomerase A (cyclophilin A)
MHGMGKLSFAFMAGVFALALILAGCAGYNAQPQGNSTMTNSTPPAPVAEIAVFNTSMGVFEVQLDRAKAPLTVANFVSYVQSGFYDGTIFHRVIPGFMVQGGGFTSNGTQKPTNPAIKLESGNGLSNQKGTVAMARTNVPNSATSQFFVNVVDNPFLDKANAQDGNGYAVFGKVVSGMDVVMKISAVQTTTVGYMQDWPVESIVINKAYMKN